MHKGYYFRFCSDLRELLAGGRYLIVTFPRFFFGKQIRANPKKMTKIRQTCRLFMRPASQLSDFFFSNALFITQTANTYNNKSYINTIQIKKLKKKLEQYQ